MKYLSIILATLLAVLIAYILYNMFVLTNRIEEIGNEKITTDTVIIEKNFTVESKPQSVLQPYIVYNGQTGKTVTMNQQLIDSLTRAFKLPYSEIDSIFKLLGYDRTYLTVDTIKHQGNEFIATTISTGKVLDFKLEGNIKQTEIRTLIERPIELRKIMLGTTILGSNNAVSGQLNAGYQWKDNTLIYGVGKQYFNNQFNTTHSITYLRTIKSF